MKIWRLDILDPHDGCLVSWHGYALGVSDAISAYADAHDMHPKDVNQLSREVDIPTTRAGLVDWLNRHFTTDNG